MQQMYDLEINILSCLLQKPELMKQIKLEDKHFIKHQQLWKFMKSFYEKFGTFDLVIMFNICRNKNKIMSYIEWLVEVEPSVSNFEKYQDLLIELYKKNEEEREKVSRIFDLTMKLYNSSISLADFKEEIKNI